MNKNYLILITMPSCSDKTLDNARATYNVRTTEDKIIEDKIIEDKIIEDKIVEDKIIEDKTISLYKVQNSIYDILSSAEEFQKEVLKIIQEIYKSKENDIREILSKHIKYNTNSLDNSIKLIDEKISGTITIFYHSILINPKNSKTYIINQYDFKYVGLIKEKYFELDEEKYISLLLGKDLEDIYIEGDSRNKFSKENRKDLENILLNILKKCFNSVTIDIEGNELKIGKCKIPLSEFNL